MAAFRILCRITEVSPQHYEARVFVVPEGELATGLATRSESRNFDNVEVAGIECLRMAEAMRSRLSRAGHEVCSECAMDGNEARTRISKSLEHHEEEAP